MRPDTERLWSLLKTQPELKGFTLVGGTALALHLGHRVSEDLDFMIKANKLPRRRIEALKRECAEAGFEFLSVDSVGALAEFEDTGMDYADYQQDYMVGGTVKLTLVAPDPEVARLLREGTESGPRIAGIDEIFQLKCIACANRTKSRDWLDVYMMLKAGYFQPSNIYLAFELAGVPSKLDIAMMRMTTGVPGITDEGYVSLLDNPPSLDEMRSYFKQVFNEMQIEVTAMKARALAQTQTQTPQGKCLLD